MPPEQHIYTLGESGSSSSVPFDKLSIKDWSNPKEAREQIRKGLKIDQDVFKDSLIENGVSQKIINSLFQNSEDFANKAMRADQLAQEHPEFEDVALVAFAGSLKNSIDNHLYLTEEAKQPYPNSQANYVKRNYIDTIMFSYSKKVEQGVAFKLAGDQDLKGMMDNIGREDNMGHFPNILKSFQRKGIAPLNHQLTSR